MAMEAVSLVIRENRLNQLWQVNIVMRWLSDALKKL